jgi:hypothetical protein
VVATKVAEAKATEVVAAEAAEAEVVEVVVAEAREVAEVAVVAIVAAMDRGRATIVVVVVVELGPKWSRSAAEKVVAQVRAKAMVEAEVGRGWPSAPLAGPSEGRPVVFSATMIPY